MALVGIVNSQPGTSLPEDFAVLVLPPTAESIGKNVLVGGDPLGVPLEAMFDLGGGKVAGHLESDLVASSAVLEEIPAGGGICLPGDAVTIPGGPPQIASDDVGQELQVSDVEA